MTRDRGLRSGRERGSKHPAREEVPPELRRTVDRALRRLEFFEWVLLAVAMVFSIGGGALVALLAHELAGAPFRLIWMLASVLFFGIPGWLVLWRGIR